MDSEVDDALEAELIALEESVAEPRFKERGQAFEKALRAARLPQSLHSAYWDRYQTAWKARRRAMAARQSQSEVLMAQYKNRIWSLDYSHSGPPILQTFTDWEDVGDKTRAARAALNVIATELRADARLFHDHADEVFRLVDDTRSAINNAADTARGVHAERAWSTINELAHSIDSVSVGAAFASLKSAQAEIKALFLSSSERDLCKRAIQDLWDRVKARGADQHIQWRTRLEQGLSGLCGARDRRRDLLERIRANLDKNRDQLGSARTSEYAAQVEQWIQEDEEKVRDLENAIDELEAKILDAEAKLRS